MQVFVTADPRSGTYLVWAWERRGSETNMYEYRPTPGGQQDMCLAEDGWEFGASLEGREPTFRLPYEVADALLDAYNPGLNPGNALSEALVDARQVRDRLLTLVEGQLTSTS